jgi:membrane protein DedA with SNARE-associated domain
MKPAPLVLSGLLVLVLLYRRRQLTRLSAGLAAVVLTGLLAYATGLIDPPPVETVIEDVATALGPAVYVLVGAFSYFETAGGVGLVAPGDLAVMLGGVSAAQGEIDLVPLIALVWACALAGDITSFMLGRRLGRSFLLRFGRRLGVTERRLQQVERFYAAHGGKTILIGRFIGFVRPLSPFIAGTSRMAPARFIPLTIIASGVWAVTFSLLGYAFRQSLPELVDITSKGSLVLGAVAAIVLLGVIGYRRRRGERSLERDRRPAPGDAG